MKKTYIEPKNTTVALGSMKMICSSVPERGTTPFGQGAGNGTPDITGDNLSREVIDIPDAWEEW
jgi:hypothetical protein